MTTPRIYTRTGDLGQTSLVTGDRVAKSDLRLEAYGTVDELNSSIGGVVSHLKLSGMESADQEPILKALAQIQNQLFNVGSQLACNQAELSFQLPQIELIHIEFLEKQMDQMQSTLPELKNFILPGGSIVASQAHMARTICRRAERICCHLSEIQEKSHQIPAQIIPYLNRLNDYFFVLARFLNHKLNIKDVIWEK